MVRPERSKPRRINSKSTEFKASFVIAHSQRRIEGVMGTNSSFNQVKFLIFLKDLLLKLENEKVEGLEKVILVADNWRFHKTEMIKQFLEKKKIVWIFIPPYSPELNPGEKLINFIKMFVKNQIRKQKHLNLMLYLGLFHMLQYKQL